MTTAWHICISGYRQREDRHNGIFDLWRQLSRYDSAAIRSHYARWDDDFEPLAAMIHHASQLAGSPPLVAVYAFSYGAGWGMPRFARALEHYGLPVAHALLSDPINRFRIRWLNWLSLRWWLNWQRVVVPANVAEVHHWRQTHDAWVRGHNVIAADRQRTTVHPPVIVPSLTHSAMDDLALFHRTALKIAHAMNFRTSFQTHPISPEPIEQ